MAELEKYKGYQLSVNFDGQFEARLGGEVCLKKDTMKAIKEAVDRASKKAFKPFEAWVRDGSYYDSNEPRKYKKVTVTAVSPLTHKIYWKRGKDNNGQDTPDDVFLDSPENIKLMDEAVRLEVASDKAQKESREAEEKVKRVDVKKYLDSDKED